MPLLSYLGLPLFLGQRELAGLFDQILEFNSKHVREAKQRVHGWRSLFLFDETHGLPIEPRPGGNDIERKISAQPLFL